MTKELTTLEILNVLSWYAQAQDRMKHFPVKLQWYLKQNIEKIRTIGEQFSTLRAELADGLENDWFNSDRAEDYTDEETGESGRRIKEECQADFEAAVAKCNAEITSLLDEKNTVDIITFNIDAFVDSLDDAAIGDEHTLQDLNVIALLMNER